MEAEGARKPKLWTRNFILLGVIQTRELFIYNMVTPVIAPVARID